MVLLLTTALAGSYDSLEIGGLWGSPTANGGEAPWWNPAGMAMDSGFRASGELAYSWGNNRFERTGALPDRDWYADEERSGGIAGILQGLTNHLQHENLHRIYRFQTFGRNAVGAWIENNVLYKAAPL